MAHHPDPDTAQATPPPGPDLPAPGEGAGLALVTVTHDSAAELERLIASVARHLPGARLVVVDCASRDASLAVARAAPAPVSVQTLALTENAGFGRGSNAGVAAVHEPATALVNPDVELVDGSLARLAALLERPGAPDALLAPRLERSGRAPEISVHAAPVSWSTALSAVVPPAALPARWRAAVQPHRSATPQRVAWATGACLVGRTATLRRLGPFDPRIFMYAEDLELGLRAARAGVPTWFHPEGRVLHHGAHASARRWGGEPLHRLAAQRRRVVHAHYGERTARLDDWLQLLTFADRIALKRARGDSAARERRQLAALREMRRREPVPARLGTADGDG